MTSAISASSENRNDVAILQQSHSRERCGASTPAPARLSPNPALAAPRRLRPPTPPSPRIAARSNWLALDDLKSHAASRLGPNFAHPRTSEKNANLSRPLRFHPDGDAAVRVLVPVRALSDDHLEPLQTSTKPVYNLVVAAAERFRAAFCADPSAPLLLWLDFSCLDQDANPIRERGRLKELLSLSDALLTVVVDPTPPPDELLSSFGGGKGALTEYRAAHWRARRRVAPSRVPARGDDARRKPGAMRRGAPTSEAAASAARRPPPPPPPRTAPAAALAPSSPDKFGQTEHLLLRTHGRRERRGLRDGDAAAVPLRARGRGAAAGGQAG